MIPTLLKYARAAHVTTDAGTRGVGSELRVPSMAFAFD
jgi:hypothetical protein